MEKPFTKLFSETIGSALEAKIIKSRISRRTKTAVPSAKSETFWKFACRERNDWKNWALRDPYPEWADRQEYTLIDISDNEFKSFRYRSISVEDKNCSAGIRLLEKTLDIRLLHARKASFGCWEVKLVEYEFVTFSFFEARSYRIWSVHFSSFSSLTLLELKHAAMVLPFALFYRHSY